MTTAVTSSEPPQGGLASAGLSPYPQVETFKKILEVAPFGSNVRLSKHDILSTTPEVPEVAMFRYVLENGDEYIGEVVSRTSSTVTMRNYSAWY